MKKLTILFLTILISAISYSQSKNDKGMIEAAANGDEARFDYFIKAGAKVNATDSLGYTALIYASGYGYTSIMKKLIKKGASVNAFKNDVNPLFAAVNHDNTNSIQVLIKAGANVNQADSHGYTPLMLAAQENYTKTINFLLKKGAKINQENKDGHTALSIAIQREQDEAIDLLLKNKPKKTGYSNYSTSPLNTAEYFSNKKASKKLQDYGMKKKFKPGIQYLATGTTLFFTPLDLLFGYELKIHEVAMNLDLTLGYAAVSPKVEIEIFTSNYLWKMQTKYYGNLNKNFNIFTDKFKGTWGFSIGIDGLYAKGIVPITEATDSEFNYGANAGIYRDSKRFYGRLHYTRLLPNTNFYPNVFSFSIGVRIFNFKNAGRHYIHADKTLYML